jgi:hypothetical protein
METSMPKPKLILVEGIPGSGKTTTARLASDWLEQHGHRPALFLEGDWTHPADYESVACLEEGEYAGLQARFPAYVDFLWKHARLENGEWFFSYRKMQHEHGEQAPDLLFEALARFEIYDLPAEKHQRLMRQGWQNFADRALADEFIYVFECCFLQNPTTTLLARHNLPIESVHHHLLALAESIQPLQPRIIYLAPQNPRAALENIRKERSQEWADYVTWYLTGQDYGKKHGLSGFEGVIHFYIIRQALELAILPALPMPSITITDFPEQDRFHHYLEAFLEM